MQEDSSPTPKTTPESGKPSAQPTQPTRAERMIWQGKLGPAFWSISSILSLSVNLILIIVLIFLAQYLFRIKTIVDKPLIRGLYTSFEQMDQAHIKTTILVEDTIIVNDSIPVVFDLPLQQNTVVTLVKNTPIKNATIYINNQPVPLDLVLKKGTELAISLDLIVPVNQTIPVTLNVPVSLSVPVDIPLDQTDLHDPFVGLQGAVYPYYDFLLSQHNEWEDYPICNQSALNAWVCDTFLTP